MGSTLPLSTSPLVPHVHITQLHELLIIPFNHPIKTHGSSHSAIPTGGSFVWKLARSMGIPRACCDFTNPTMTATRSPLRGLSDGSVIVSLLSKGSGSGCRKTWDFGGSKKGERNGRRSSTRQECLYQTVTTIYTQDCCTWVYSS